MKKLMLVLGLMGIVVFSFAGEKKTGELKTMKIEKTVLLDGTEFMEIEKPKMCTVSQSAKVSIYVVDYTVTCTATEETCEAAITSSLNCVKSAVDRLRKALTQN